MFTLQKKWSTFPTGSKEYQVSLKAIKQMHVKIENVVFGTYFCEVKREHDGSIKYV